MQEIPKKKVEESDVLAAYARLAGLNRDQYEQLMLTFSMAQKKLLEDGHIEQFATECRIADPFFAEFLRLI